MAVKELAKAGGGLAEAFPTGAISVGLVALGSVLALGTSFALEVWRTRRADRRKVLLLKRFLQHEIPLMIKMVNNILSDLEEHHGFTKYSLQSITRFQQGFDRNREWVALIEDKELRQMIFGYFSMIDVFCNSLEEAAGLASEVGLPVEGIKHFVMFARPFIETGEILLERLDKL